MKKDTIKKTFVFDDSIIYDVIDDIKKDYLMPEEREVVNNEDYDEYNFEEDELEEDDYYNEDLD